MGKGTMIPLMPEPTPPVPKTRKPRPVVREKASIEALMHGIFAITMTLLILDLRLPETEDQGHLWEALKDLGPEVVGYLFGFVYLMAIWLSLRDFFRQLSGVTHALSVLFLLVVGLVSLTPFTVSTIAAAIGDNDDLGTAVRLMAALVGVSFLLSAGVAKLALHQGLVPATPFYTTSWPLTVVLSAGPAAFGFALSYLNPWLGIAVLSTDILLGIFMNRFPPEEPASG
jgi:uncharacterized membrane protein